MDDPQMNQHDIITKLNDMTATIDEFYEIGAKVVEEYADRSKQRVEGSPRINNFSQCDLIEAIVVQTAAEMRRLIDEEGAEPTQAAGEATHKAFHIAMAYTIGFVKYLGMLDEDN